MASDEGLAGLCADVPLAPQTTLGVGGAARWWIRATTPEQVAVVHDWCRVRGVPLTVLGGGSNVVVADHGVDGLVLQIAIGGLSIGADGDITTLRAGAGAPWDGVVAEAVSKGLAGLECLSGIPGSVGGTPIQNVGAYGQDVAESIREVTVLDRLTGALSTMSNAECCFGYRTSRFKHDDAGRFIVCAVRYDLRRGAPTVTYPDLQADLDRRAIRSPSVADVRASVLAVRRGKGMVVDAADPDTRSVGSFFTNPVVEARVHAGWRSPAGAAPGHQLPGGAVKVPAAWLIEQSGFARGHVAGRVGLSSKHPLALINRGGASARDVVALARTIQARVVDRFGVWLRAEPTFVGFGDDADIRFLERAH